MSASRVPRTLSAMLLVAVAAAPWLGCSKDDGNPAAPRPGGPAFGSPILPPGGSFSFTFADSGSFGYRCGVHPGIMFGNSVTVTALSNVDSVVVNIVGTSTPGFAPSAATIKIGGTVRWVNVHSVSHSVQPT